MTRDIQKALDLLEALSHADALDAVTDDELAAEDRKYFGFNIAASTARIEQTVNREAARSRRTRLEHAREARLSRLEGEANPTVERSRSSMLEKLGEMLSAFPQLQAAHRDFEGMSDTDLRSLLEDFERLTNDDGR